MRVYASGLRNPVGLAVHPESKALWAAVNERDMLGDELVPDYLTSVKEGAFYGWPYAYFGPIEDPRKKGERPDLVAKTIPPDFSLGAHVAPLGLAFYTGASFPARYRNGAFVALHGSWNRSRFSGYKVVFVPFAAGPAVRTRRRLPHRVHPGREREHGPWPSRWSGAARGRLAARGRRWRELRLAGERGEVARARCSRAATGGRTSTRAPFVHPAAERLNLRIAREPLERPLILCWRMAILVNHQHRRPDLLQVSDRPRVRETIAS